MKQFCLKCGRISDDGNRWCPEIDCWAEEGPALLDYGDYLGDVKVVKLLRMLRASAIYEGERGKQKVLLKVANPGDECAERLKREAKILAALRPGLLPPLMKAFVPEQRPTSRCCCPLTRIPPTSTAKSPSAASEKSTPCSSTPRAYS